MAASMQVLHVNASPRGAASTSLEVAEKFLSELQKIQQIQVDRFDLFSGGLPEFGETAAAAKMALFSGSEMSEQQAQAWENVRRVFLRLEAADLLLINTPLWNNGTPYILKQYVDLVTQPGWSFGFDPSSGYIPLMNGRQAVLVQASGVYHENIQPGFGADFNSPYLIDWFKFLGIELVGKIDFSPTVMNADVSSTKAEAFQQAKELAVKAAQDLHVTRFESLSRSV